MKRLILACLFGFIFGVGNVWAAGPYYVDGTISPASCATYRVGFRDCTGGTNTAYKTINGLLNAKILISGDIVYIRAGTYNEAISTDTAAIPSGSASAWTTFSGYQAERPTITGGLVVSLITDSNQQYLSFEEFIVDRQHTQNDGVYFANFVSHARLKNMEIRNVDATSGNPKSCVLTGADFLWIQGGSIHDCGAGDTAYTSHAVYTTGSDGIIEDVEIYNSTGAGIQHYDRNASRATYRRNKIHNTNGGFVLYAGTGNKAYNNLVYSNLRGFSIGGGNTGQVIYENTITGNTQEGIDDGGGSGTIIRNNIIWNNGSTITAGGGEVASNNLFTDPHFLSPTDFHLTTLSTLNTGFNLVVGSEYAADYANVPRPQGAGWDIGAYEFTGGTIPTVLILVPKSDGAVISATPTTVSGTSSLP